MRGGRIGQTWGLTPEALLDQERQAPPRIAERLQAVRLIGQGYPVKEVGRMVGRHPGAVRRYLQDWNQGGPEALALGHAPGARPKLTPEHTAAVCAALPQSPQAVGVGPAVHGDSKILPAYIEPQYGVRFSRGHLRQGLPQHGFSGTRPPYVLKRARPAEQAAFRDELATLNKTPRPTR